jgi:putative phosphoribosyl transferase
VRSQNQSMAMLDDEVAREIDVEVRWKYVRLAATLGLPNGLRGAVVFAHGSGSNRSSPRNQFVARHLRDQQLATLLLDLLTPGEERADLVTSEHRFDIEMLGSRLIAAVDWLEQRLRLSPGGIGCFGASTGAAAALIAAAARPALVGAVVARGGRVDLVGGETLAAVRAPTLLVVGGRDDAVIDLNRQALEHLQCEKRLEIVPGATHLFEEPGALGVVARLAAGWFERSFAAMAVGPAMPERA